MWVCECVCADKNATVIKLATKMTKVHYFGAFNGLLLWLNTKMRGEFGKANIKWKWKLSIDVSVCEHGWSCKLFSEAKWLIKQMKWHRIICINEMTLEEQRGSDQRYEWTWWHGWWTNDEMRTLIFGKWLNEMSHCKETIAIRYTHISLKENKESRQRHRQRQRQQIVEICLYVRWMHWKAIWNLG